MTEITDIGITDITDRTERGPKRAPAVLGVLALAGLALCAMAGEPAASEETAKSPKNGLKWSTASEVDNFGYDIYRGKSEDGPFERITSEPILGAGTTDETSTYEFVDDTIEPDTTYWYYVESISKNGHRERFTPFRQLARKSSDPEAGSEEEE